MTVRTKLELRIPAMLLALSVVPIVGGLARLYSLSPSAAMKAENARFVANPAPVVVHVICATLYCLLGAFQFSSSFRLRWPRWHRQAGKLLAVCGLLAGLSGVWMALTYPIPEAMQGPLLRVVRVVVGVSMMVSIALAWRRIVMRDVVGHQAWMIRAYALGQGAGTQVVVLLPWMLITGKSGGLTRDLLMTLAWIVNFVVGEWIIRSHGVSRPVAASSTGEPAEKSVLQRFLSRAG